MTQMFDIAQVAQLTGLTSRALRFYEARGLVKPLRTGSGRRCYGAGELERLHQLLAFKRAGLSLGQIKSLFDRHPVDLRALVTLQLDTIDTQARALAEARAVLSTTLSRIDRGEPIDAETFCSLIRHGDAQMKDNKAAWEAVTDRYMSDEAKADFARTLPQMGTTFDAEATAAQWKNLGNRIKAAMPLNEKSPAALAFVREWFALLAPFTAVATPAMWEDGRKMYSRMDEWHDQADPGFDLSVWNFIQSATAAAKAAGHDIGPMPHFTTT